MKKYALHLTEKVNGLKTTSRWGTTTAPNKAKARQQFTELYCMHQTVGALPKGAKVDELI